MWTQTDLLALKREITALRYRYEIEEFLARSYGLMATERGGLWEYTTGGLEGWLVLRYEQDCVVAVSWGAAT